MTDAAVLARRLTSKYGTSNPFELCEILGILVRRHALKDTGLRGYFVNRKEVNIITIASELGESPASFVCGHELGHAVQDGNKNRVFLDKHTYIVPDKYENRADKFSAHLHWGGPPLYDEYRLSNWEIADCLNVSVCSVDSRLYELGIYY